MNRRIMIIAVMIGCVVGAGAFGEEAEGAAEKVTLSPEQAGSYSAGIQLGRRLKAMGAEVDREMVIRGMNDALDSKPLLMPEDELRKQARDFMQKAQMRQVEEMQKLMGKNKAAQEAFLQENKGKEGVTTLENGLQYRVIKSGEGKTPAMTDRVKFRYTGRLLDGTVFESSDKDEDGKVSQVNKLVMSGMRQALVRMKEGDKWELYVPSALGYGTQPVPKVGPNQLLVVELELLEVLPPDETPARTPATVPAKPEAEKQ